MSALGRVDPRSIDPTNGYLGGVPLSPMEIDIDKLKGEAKNYSTKFRVSMAFAGLAAIGAIALKILGGAAVVALGLTPVGWAAIGLGLILLAAAYFITRRRMHEGEILEKEKIVHGSSDLDPNESMKKELKKGLWMLCPVYGWIKVYREESQELKPLTSAGVATPSPASSGNSSRSQSPESAVPGGDPNDDDPLLASLPVARPIGEVSGEL